VRTARLERTSLPGHSSAAGAQSGESHGTRGCRRRRREDSWLIFPWGRGWGWGEEREDRGGTTPALAVVSSGVGLGHSEDSATRDERLRKKGSEIARELSKCR
jgi:hypothetical protein